MAQGGERPTNPSDIGAVCHAAAELLRAGHVAQAAEALSQAQAGSVQAGDQVLAHVLAAVCRTCLAYTQSRLEVDWYRRMYDQAVQREQDVLHSLVKVLDLIAGQRTEQVLAAVQGLPLRHVSPNVPPRDGFWQRLRGLFGRKPRPLGPAPDIPVDLSGDPGPIFPGGPTSEIVQSLPHTSQQHATSEQTWADTIQAIDTVVPPDVEPGYEQAVVPAPGTEPTAETKVAPAPGTQPPAAAEPRDRSSVLLTIYGLGPFRAYHGDRPIDDWASLKARSILKYLVMHRETLVLKDILMDRFWPDADPQAARRNLHQAIYSLRRTLRQGQSHSGHIRFEDDCYSLDPALDLWVDWEEFESSAQAGHQLETAGQIEEAMSQYGIAESLYQGDFLEEDVYEDWTSARRERLRRIYCDVAQRLSEYHLRKREYHAAITLCQKILARDNCNEQAHRCLMRCYLAQGQRHLAMRQHQICVATLKQELGFTPSKETQALYASITGLRQSGA